MFIENGIINKPSLGWGWFGMNRKIAEFIVFHIGVKGKRRGWGGVWGIVIYLRWQGVCFVSIISFRLNIERGR